MQYKSGGGFTYCSGSSRAPLYDGAAFMFNQNVVFVSKNYRLGALGYLSLQSILNATDSRTTGKLLLNSLSVIYVST